MVAGGAAHLIPDGDRRLRVCLHEVARGVAQAQIVAAQDHGPALVPSQVIQHHSQPFPGLMLAGVAFQRQLSAKHPGIDVG